MKAQKSVTENPPKTLNRILYEIGMERILNREIDRKAAERKAAEESRTYARISRFLVSLWEIKEILCQLKDGHSIVINSNGEIFTGRVKTDSLVKRPELLPGKKDAKFDVGTHEFLATRSWVFSPGNPMKHVWENNVKIAPREHGNATVALFEMKLATVDSKDITKEFFTDIQKQSYVKIAIKNYPVAVVMHVKTGKIYSYFYQGKEYNV